MKKNITSQIFIFLSLGMFVLLMTGYLLPVEAKGKLGQGQQRFEVDDDVLAEYEALQAYIGELPKDELRNSLLVKLKSSKKQYIKGKTCTAANILNAYLNHTAALMRREKPTPIAEDLRNRGAVLLRNLLLGFQEKEQCKRFAGFGKEPDFEVEAADNERLAASIAFGMAEFHSETGGGEKWTRLDLPAVQAEIGEPGMPAIPVWHGLVAVPRGASVHLKSNSPVIRGEVPMNLYPFQEQFADHVDLKYQRPPFIKNELFYDTDEFYPPEPCSVELVGNVRGLNIAQLSCATGQYNPAQKLFRAFESVQVEVVFEGGDGSFLTTRDISPFETTAENSIADVLNSSVVKEYLIEIDISALEFYGEELLILTHPDFRAAADDLAEWKEAKGIITSVFEVGDGTEYDTGEEIDDLIEYRYENCLVRPSYVLLLGDAEFIPPARLDHDTSNACGPCGDLTTGSDYDYAVYPESLIDIFPDLSVGRMAVNTATEAQRVVDKVITYESAPPFIDWYSGAPFYTTAANAAEFQGYLMDADGSPRDDLDGRAQRSFTESSEFVRSHMVAAGYTVERIYQATEDPGGHCVDDEQPCTRQQPYTGDATPDRYKDGSLLPDDLRADSDFAWDGNASDIANAFNEGRFLILHRDHGATDGWATPTFSTDHIDYRLTNGELLPVVYSINCSSGFWDMETDETLSSRESFMEQLLTHEGGGMVGGLGDNRNSPTWANSALTRGFYDATWPSVAPEFGDSFPITRLGDILNHGKMYLLSQIGVAQTAGSVTAEAAIGELIIWHAFGDPTLEMWTDNPYSLVLSTEHWAQLHEEVLDVGYAVDGAQITAFQLTEKGTVPVGRGTVENGVASIPLFHPPVTGTPILLSASFPNSVSVLLTSPSDVDLVVEQLADASFAIDAGASIADKVTIKVSNSGAGEAPGTINPDTSTKDGYMIDMVLSTDQSVPDGWAVSSDTFVEDGLLMGGRISRTPDVNGGTTVTLSNAPPVSSDIGGIIPADTDPGEYYLCARIDPGNVVAELKEDNNVTCLLIKVE